MMHIAFLTNEFVIEKPDGGGLGNYLNRISKVLHESGHLVEIFVRRSLPNTPAVMDFNGIRVEHVDIERDCFFRLIKKFDNRFLHAPWGGLADYYGTARALARAFERRHKNSPFDFVQSTNCGASGLFVRRKIGRPHLARLSSIRELTFAQDGLMNGLGARLMAWMESASVNRADIIYAPSQYSADYYRNYRKRYVHVLRPPSYLELDHIKTNTGDLPARYMIHFGSIGPVKGSDWLAEALPIVWSVAPDFSMIWAGPERVPGAMRQYRELWGKHADKVIWLGAVEKSQLYGLLRLAEAAVLPSRVDNLPNSVIESLQLEVPVIGSKGASIDELIEDGQSGTLVPIGDVTALAEAIVVAWKGEAAWSAKGFQPPAVLEEFIPENAVKNLIALATKT